MTFLLAFAVLPVAREAPATLKHANVIAVFKKGGKPTLITDTMWLETFFRAHARAVTEVVASRKSLL